MSAHERLGLGVDDVRDDADGRILVERDQARSRTAPARRTRAGTRAARRPTRTTCPGPTTRVHVQRAPPHVGTLRLGIPDVPRARVAPRDAQLAGARRRRSTARSTGRRRRAAGSRRALIAIVTDPASARACSPCDRCSRRTRRPRSREPAPRAAPRSCFTHSTTCAMPSTYACDSKPAVRVERQVARRRGAASCLRRRRPPRPSGRTPCPRSA